MPIDMSKPGAPDPSRGGPQEGPPGDSRQPLERWLRPRGAAGRPPRGSGIRSASAIGVAGIPECDDLATNVPGTACVQRARELRSASPIRTRAERLLMVRTPEANLRATAVAERKVATVLNKLGPTWRVLHSVPVGPDRPEVSHLVIGPHGVFTLASRVFRSAYRSRPQMFSDRVEAQVMGDSIRIHGEHMPWVAEARAQAWRTARALTAAAGEPVYVRPAVVVLGVDDVRVYQPADRVEVLTRGLIRTWMQRFPVELRATSIDRIYGAARRGDTWIDPRNVPLPERGAQAETVVLGHDDTVVLDKPEP